MGTHAAVYQTGPLLPVKTHPLRKRHRRLAHVRLILDPLRKVGNVNDDGVGLVDGDRSLLKAVGLALWPVRHVSVDHNGSQERVDAALAQAPEAAQRATGGCHAPEFKQKDHT